MSVRELVQTCSDSCKSTALENRVTGEKGPESELELGTYGTKGRLGTKDLDRD